LHTVEGNLLQSFYYQPLRRQFHTVSTEFSTTLLKTLNDLDSYPARQDVTFSKMPGNPKQSSQLTATDYKKLYAEMLRLRKAATSRERNEAVSAACMASLRRHGWLICHESLWPRIPQDGRWMALPSLVMALGAAAVAKTGHNAVLAWWDGEDIGRSEGSLRYALDQRLPLILVSIGAAPKQQEFQHRGIPVVTVDAADAVAILRVAQESVFRARLGGGPSHIRCVRVDETDPLTIMQRYLVGKKLWTERWRAQLDKKLDKKRSR
jgi:hypothetical protein